MSVISWAIMVQKSLILRKIRKESKKFLEAFWHSRNLEKLYDSTKASQPSPLLSTFQSAYVELIKLSRSTKTTDSPSTSEPKKGTLDLGKIDNVERALRRTATIQIDYLERYLSFLATTGSTAPFIGLFGTVIGIMRAFHQIGLAGSASISEVAPGISEALLATAAGLGAAIPAVVAFNLFRSKIRQISTDLETFSSDFLNIVKRNFCH